MSLMHINFESKYLRGNTEVTAVLPSRPHNTAPEDFYESQKKYPVLWLFHGTYGDHSDWLRHTCIELYAEERNCIVIMPSGGNTYFQNYPGFGPGYYVKDYIMKELLPLVRGWLPASSRREDNYTAGLSMGSIAALMFLTEYPELFSGGIMLSAFPSPAPAIYSEAQRVLSQPLSSLEEQARDYMTPFDPAFHDFRMRNDIHNSGSAKQYVQQRDFLPKLRSLAKDPCAPRLYFACGTEDPNYPNFCFLREYLKTLPLEAAFEEGDGGHDWRFWNKYIEKGMNYCMAPK